MLDQDSRMVAVGATGPYGGAQIAYMRNAGSCIVASAALGRGGQSADGIRTFDHISDAVETTKANTAMIYTPAGGVRQALMDCADAGIRLAAAAAEFVPVHDALYAISYARERGMMIVGPNTVGMSSPGKAMLGAIAPEFTKPGRVGLIGRSGTLTMTIAKMLTARGIGQSTIVHVGGDSITGGNPHEWLQLFLDDPETDAVAYVGEIGGTKEYHMLDLIADSKKPISTMIVGRSAPPGKRMGHAGALIGGVREGAEAKLAALSEAGAFGCRSPSQLAESIVSSLRERAATAGGSVG